MLEMSREIRPPCLLSCQKNLSNISARELDEVQQSKGKNVLQRRYNLFYMALDGSASMHDMYLNGIACFRSIGIP